MYGLVGIRAQPQHGQHGQERDVWGKVVLELAARLVLADPRLEYIILIFSGILLWFLNSNLCLENEILQDFFQSSHYLT